jgi:hypothetical protein
MSETENLPAKIVTSIKDAITADADLMSRYEIAKQVTRQVLRQEDGKPFYVEFESAVYKGEELVPSRGGAAKMAAADLANVIDLLTGELCVLIVNAVLKSELERHYPGEGYIGRKFAIRRANPGGDTDKRYKVYQIIELREKGSAHEGVKAIDGTTREAVDNAKKKKA